MSSKIEVFLKRLYVLSKSKHTLKTFVKLLYSMVRTNLIPLYLFGDLVVNLMEIAAKYFVLYYSEEDVMFRWRMWKILYSYVNLKEHM